MKYVIDIEDKPICEFDQDTQTYFPRVWKAKRFNTLVFDKEGLGRLEPLESSKEKEIKEAYEQGLKDAWETAVKIVNSPLTEHLDEIFNTTYAEDVIPNITAKSAIQAIKQYEKIMEIKPGDVIRGEDDEMYLVVKINDKSYICISGNNFEPVSIGKSHIKYYESVHDSKDLARLINFFAKGRTDG